MSKEKARGFFEFVKMMRDAQRKWEVLRDRSFLSSKRYWEQRVNDIISNAVDKLLESENKHKNETANNNRN